MAKLGSRFVATIMKLMVSNVQYLVWILRGTVHQRRNMTCTFLQRILIASALWIVPAPYVAQAALSEEKAIELANKEIVKWGVTLSGWESSLDKNRRDWQLTRESWEKWVATVGKGRAIETNARIAELENSMKGREVWSVVYNRKVPPGTKVFHTHAIVFLDATTGDVIAVVNPEE